MVHEGAIHQLTGHPTAHLAAGVKTRLRARSTERNTRLHVNHADSSQGGLAVPSASTRGRLGRGRATLVHGVPIDWAAETGQRPHYSRTDRARAGHAAARAR